MGWFGRPEDLAGTVVYLASDAAKYVSGHDLTIDGGHTVNVWLGPIERTTPPLVSEEEEIRTLKEELDLLGIEYDSDGVVK
jgi:hypothetical protein